MKRLAALLLLAACDVADPVVIEPVPPELPPDEPAPQRCRHNLDCPATMRCHDERCVPRRSEPPEPDPLDPQDPPDDPDECGVECEGGVCESTCRFCDGVEDCYRLDAYCAEYRLCYGASPGDPGNDCGRSELAPPKADGGPLLFASFQDGACTKDPVSCPNNANVCSFAAYVYDPDGDLPSSDVELYEHVFLIGPAGEQLFSFDVPRLDAAAGTLAVRGCFDESLVDLVGAMQLQDLAGHDSNALCFEGYP